MNIVNTEVGPLFRTFVVTEVTVHPVEFKANGKMVNANKVELTMYDPEIDREFRTSDAWVIVGKNQKKVKGLWVYLAGNKQQISPYSGAGQVLRYYNVKTLTDLKGRKVKTYPHNNFLTLVACDMQLVD